MDELTNLSEDALYILRNGIRGHLNKEYQKGVIHGMIYSISILGILIVISKKYK